MEMTPHEFYNHPNLAQILAEFFGLEESQVKVVNVQSGSGWLA